MAFEYPLTVRFHHIDRAGIAFFARAFEFCHEAFEELLTQIGLPLGSLFDDAGWGMPLVHVASDYKRPMLLGTPLIIRLEVERLSKRSLTLRFEILSAADRSLHVRLRHIHAFVSAEGFTPIEVPTALRTALTDFGLLPPAEPVPAP